MTLRASAIILALICFTCAQVEKPLCNFADPYAASFWNRNLKMCFIVNKAQPHFIDTIRFDTAGNIVEVTSYGYSERQSFDEGHFIKKRRISGDVFINSFYEYKRMGDSLFRYEDEVHTMEWNFDPTQTKVDHVTFTKFFLDDEGRIATAINHKKYVTKYRYVDNTSDHLLLKGICEL